MYSIKLFMQTLKYITTILSLIYGSVVINVILEIKKGLKSCNRAHPLATAIAGHHYSSPCYQATSPPQPLVSPSVGPLHKQPTVNEAPLER